MMTTLRRPATLAVLVVLLTSTGCIGRLATRSLAREIQVEEGDILFQSLPGELPALIASITHSPYTHCGVVIDHPRHGLCVLEAADRVQVTRLHDWLAQSRDHRVTVCRLRPDYRRHIPAFIAACRAYTGRAYDPRFRMDDKTLYCSELIWKGYRAATGKQLGEPVRLVELDWKPHAAAIRELDEGNLPLERLLITPRDLARAPQLEVVYSNFPPATPTEAGQTAD